MVIRSDLAPAAFDLRLSNKLDFQDRMRSSALLHRLLIALLVASLILPVSVGLANPPQQVTPIPLEQAILNGQVDVKAIPIQPGMKFNPIYT